MKNSEVLKCPVCYFEYDKANFIPKLLPDCGHTLCSKCIDKILAMQSPKCPLDRKPINNKYQQSISFPTNGILNQLLVERPSVEYDICPLHKEPKSLFCITDQIKICPSCVDAKDDAIHSKHEVKALSEIQNQAEEKIAQLKANVIMLDEGENKITELFEEKKKEAFGLKKRKFDVIRSYIDAKENEFSSELGLLFAQKKTKTEQQFMKDQTLKQQLKIHLNALSENKYDEAFFNALNKSGIKEKDLAEKEKQELDNITKKLEGELNLSEGNINKSLVTTFEQFGPQLHRIVQETEVPSEKVDSDEAMLLYVSSLVQARRKGEVFELFHPDKGRNEDDIKDDIVKLQDHAGVKSVKLNFVRQKVGEETLFALGYLWKGLINVNNLSIVLSLKYNTVKDFIGISENSFWISDKIESFSFAFTYYNVESGTNTWNEPQSSSFFSPMTRMINLKSLSLDFSGCHFTDQGLINFGNHVVPALRQLEVLYLNLSISTISDAGIKGLFSKASGVLQKVNSFSLNVGDSQVSIDCLEILTRDGLPSFGPLEKFSFAIDEPIGFDESKLNKFWPNLAKYMKNIKSFSFTMVFGHFLSDSDLKQFTQNVLPVMTLLEHLKLVFIEVRGITSLTIENLFKYSPGLSSLKSFELDFGGDSITDFGVHILAQDFLPAMPKLESLELVLDYNDIGDRGVSELWKPISKIAPNLTNFKFNFTHTNITDACFLDFVDNVLPKMSSITKLNLECQAPYSVDAIEEFLASFKKIANHLEDLKLSLERLVEIKDENVSNFIQNVLPFMTALRRFSFNLNHTDVTWASAESFCIELEKLKNLEYIDIRYWENCPEMPKEKLEALRKSNPRFKINSREISYR